MLLLYAGRVTTATDTPTVTPNVERGTLVQLTRTPDSSFYFTEDANVHRAATVDSEVVGAIPNRTFVTLTDISGDWAEISYVPIASGWVLLSTGIIVAPQATTVPPTFQTPLPTWTPSFTPTAIPSPTPTNTFVPYAYAQDDINVREGPGVRFDPPIATLVTGADGETTGRRSSDGGWVQILVEDGTPGWVLTEQVVIATRTITPTPTFTLTPTVDLTGTASARQTATETPSPMPSATATIIASPTSVLAPSLTPSPPRPANYSGPLVTEIPVTASPTFTPSATIDLTGTTIARQTAIPTLTPGTLTPVSGRTQDALSVYLGTSESYRPVVTTLLADTRVIVTATLPDQTWVRIVTPDAQIGWVRTELLDIDGDLTTAPVIVPPTVPPLTPTVSPASPVPVTALTDASVRSGPAFGYIPPLVTFPRGETAFAIGITGDFAWVLIRYNGVEGWVPVNELEISGDLSQLPVQNIPTATPSLTRVPATATPPSNRPTNQEMRSITIGLFPDMPPGSVTTADIEYDVNVLRARLEAYGITVTNVEVYTHSLVIRVNDNPRLYEAMNSLNRRGHVEVVNFSNLDLDVRNALLNQQVMTSTLARYYAYRYGLVASSGIDTVTYATAVPAPVFRQQFRFDPITGDPFPSLYTLHGAYSVQDVYVRSPGDGQWETVVIFDQQERDNLRRQTNGRVNQFVGITVDGVVRDAPLLEAPLTQIVIPAETLEQAEIMRVSILTGALNVPWQAMEDGPYPVDATPTPTPFGVRASETAAFATTASSFTVTPTPSPTVTRAAASSDEIIHTVQEGDTLQSIAQVYGVTVERLINANDGLTANSSLVIGANLRIPVPTPTLSPM